MRSFKRSACAGAVIGAVALASLTGCGSDSTSPGSTDLDAQTSTELAMELVNVFFFGFGLYGSMGADATMPAADAPAFSLSATESFSFTADCPQGGTSQIAGTVVDDVDENGTGSVSVDLQQTPNACVVNTSQGLFTVNGDPGLQFTSEFNLNEGEPVGVATFDIGGGFTYSGNAGSGSCGMSLSYQFNFDNQSFSMSGNVCGNSVNFST